MEICGANHEEIVFEGKECPLCSLIADHKGEIEALEAQLEQLETEVAGLEDELEESIKVLEGETEKKE